MADPKPETPESTKPKTLELTQIHVEMLRKLAVSWDTTDLGAPTIEPAAPYASVNLYGDLAPLLGLPFVEDYEQPEPEHLEQALAAHRELKSVFPVLMDTHNLVPGIFSVEDRPAFLHHAGRLSWSTLDVRKRDGGFSENAVIRYFQIFKSMWTTRRDMERAEDAGPSVVDVEITAEHLKLLQQMSPIWQNDGERTVEIGEDPSAKKLESWISQERLYPVPSFDPKRPYGDRTDIYPAMAEILGIQPDGNDLPEAELERLQSLHHDMQMVIQTVIQHGRLKPGTYRFGEIGWQLEQDHTE